MKTKSGSAASEAATLRKWFGTGSVQVISVKYSRLEPRELGAEQPLTDRRIRSIESFILSLIQRI